MRWATPSVTFTAIGLTLSGLYYAGQSWALLPAIICLAVPGVGGTAIALYQHVVRAGEEWTWQGILRAFRRPLREETKRGIATHLPQAILALWLLVKGRGKAELAQGGRETHPGPGTK